MRRALMGAVVGFALTIGTQGAAVAAIPASPAIDTRQSVIVIDPASTLPSDQDLNNQPEKSEPDGDTNSGGD